LIDGFATGGFEQADETLHSGVGGEDNALFIRVKTSSFPPSQANSRDNPRSVRAQAQSGRSRETFCAESG
jgi:hypothetical protein